jgi:hypothetical protein
MTRTEPYDSADLDAIEELERSLGWALVVERIQMQIERERTDLEKDGDPAKLRGSIAGRRNVLTIPGILRDEIERELANQK